VLRWRVLVGMAPALLLHILHRKGRLEGGAYISCQLLLGRLAMLSAHSHSVELAIGSWYRFNPGLTIDKAARGFYHLGCGRLLCPPIYNWDNAE